MIGKQIVFCQSTLTRSLSGSIVKVDNLEFSPPFAAQKWPYGGCFLIFLEQKSVLCVGLAKRCQSLASFNFTVPRPKLAEVQPQMITDSSTLSTEQAGIQFAFCVLPAICHRWYTLTLDTSCFAIKEFENTVLLVLGFARGVCDRSARGIRAKCHWCNAVTLDTSYFVVHEIAVLDCPASLCANLLLSSRRLRSG